MYGRGNHPSPIGQGSYTRSPIFEQHMHGSASTFLQGPQGPRPVHHGSLSVLPNGGQQGPPAYQHTPTGAPLSAPPILVPFDGSAQSYLPPQGSSQVRQGSRWSQSTSLIPPTVLSSAPTILPPPPLLGHAPIGSQGHQQPGGGMQAPPPSHPQAAGFYASPPVGSFGHPVSLQSSLPSVGPIPQLLPLPSSSRGSPHITSSSPPPNSSSSISGCQMPNSIPAISPNYPQSSFSVSERSGFSKSASGYGAEVSVASAVGDNGSKVDGNLMPERKTSFKMGTAYVENLVWNLTRPPPKPLNDRIVRNIEILCQFIVKNGPEFENLTRKRETGNPEFRFLFGGDPGSEDAVAHEYFIWMRNKCQLECNPVEKHGQSYHPVELFGGSSSQPNSTINSGDPYSPADSDMDMEDDITYSDEELKLSSTNDLTTKTFSMPRDTGSTNQFEVLHCTTENIPSMDITVMHSRSSGIDELRQGFETSPHQNQSIVRQSLVQVDEYVVDSLGNIQMPLEGSETSSYQNQSIENKSLARVDESVVGSFRDIQRPSDSNVYDSSFSHQNSRQHNKSIDLADRELEKLPGQLVKKPSPFKLLQVYASEGISDGEGHEAFQDDVKPIAVSSSIEGSNTTVNIQAGRNFGMGLGLKDVLGSAKELETQPESSKPGDVPVKPVNLMMDSEMAFTSRKSEDLIDNTSRSQDPVKDGVSDNELPEINASGNTGATDNKEEDVKVVSAIPKVDEFGRLIREGGSDSDSGGSPPYRRWRGKRGRSRSRSRSPHDRRRRSPWRTKEKRGRSHSLSPKRRRSRSKSPPYRRSGEYPGDKMRRDKGQPPECFDFIRGKCFRGSSCRFMHHRDKSDRSRSYRTKQKPQDLPASSRRSDLNEKTKGMHEKKLGHEHGKGRMQELKPFDMAGIKGKKAFDEPVAEILDGRDVNTAKLPDDADYEVPSVKNVEIQQLKCQYSDQILRKSDQQHEQTNNFSVSETSPMHRSSHFSSQIPVDKSDLESVKSDLNKDSSSQLYTGLNSMNKSFASENNSSQLMASQASIPPASGYPSPLAPSFLHPSQDVNSKSTQQMPGDCSGISPSGKFPPHPASFENYPDYHASIPYPHSQFPLPPNPSWNFLPPPPPALPRPVFFNNVTEALAHGRYGFHPVPFQQNMIPQKIDFSVQTSVRPSITEFPAHPHLVQNQAYLSKQGPDCPSSHLDGFRPGTYSMNQQISQPQGEAGLIGEDRLSACPSQGLCSSSSNGHGGLHSQAMPFSKDSPSKIFQALRSDSLPAGLSHTSVDGRAIEALGSSTMTPTRSSIQAFEASSPRSGDQYDPLSDSLELSLNSARKSVQKLKETDEYDAMLRHGLNKPLDVEENSKQKGGGALTASLENEEYGETADAEVGAVENGSPSNLNDDTDVAAGDVEIDQVKTHGKSQTSKDSRSMKQFKVALAGFVKEVLKPSWQQGNMSKEAFKTIVKKTVDKVSGAMKSHHIPRSQAKINHYIDSSQRKLTKLVMGYVDKYVKA